MTWPRKFIVEGIDRLGKDTLSLELQNRLGYHLTLHYGKPLPLQHYRGTVLASPERQYQQDSFATLFELLANAPHARVICNRAHLGECVYAPLYRGYPGDFVFDLERKFRVAEIRDLRLVLLTEDFSRAHHFQDDGKSLGAEAARAQEQALFVKAFEASCIVDKRVICVTDPDTGGFKTPQSIADEALST